MKHFPDGVRDAGLRDSYNRHIANMIDGVHEFLALHYYGAARTDNQYWRDTKTRPLPGGLADRMSSWTARMPDTETVFPYYHGLEPYSYQAMILGLGGLPIHPSPALSLADPTAAAKELAAARDEAASLVASLPSQYEYLANLHGLPLARQDLVEIGDRR